MYLALTYDHRMLDGREAVVFLVKVRGQTLGTPEVRTLTYLLGERVYRRPTQDAIRLSGWYPTLALQKHSPPCSTYSVLPATFLVHTCSLVYYLIFLPGSTLLR